MASRLTEEKRTDGKSPIDRLFDANIVPGLGITENIVGVGDDNLLLLVVGAIVYCCLLNKNDGIVVVFGRTVL